MSPEDSSPEPEQPSSPKRKASSTGAAVNANGRPVKRRASKACQCCRARKVRCNVVEHGAPCTNCRLDEVPCIVTESKRRKKHNFNNLKPLDPVSEHPPESHREYSGTEALASGNVNPMDISRPSMRRPSESGSSLDGDEQQDTGGHVPHALYQTQNERLHSQDYIRRSTLSAPLATNSLGNLVNRASMHGDLMSSQFRTPSVPQRTMHGSLPTYIKPLPPRMTADDIQYLWKKGALSLPEPSFRNELLRSYIEFVHPFMPLIELHEFLNIVNGNDAEIGRISLLLFQAVMFTGTAFVDKSYLEAAGFTTRRAARKAFYQKARLLYDFDYEGDRISLVQALLLMTYWYETPDDQKDTWHWMGVAISVAHTIGLHRNPEISTMDVKKQRLWKRIWWSCLMRDRLVALGMRRPTRIKDEDYDVPMLTIQDFEIQTLANDITIIPPECRLIRNTAMQEDLAILCIAKAKLALCISHVLAAQYSVLIRDQGMSPNQQEDTTRSRVILFPKKLDQTGEVTNCDIELTDWLEDLSPRYLHKTPSVDDLEREGASFLVQRALLHMVFYAAVSALHRPQVLPSAESAAAQKSRDLQDISRTKVREASKEITRMSVDLYNLNLERYLPTTGVTVLLPAIIIHLLDIKSFSDATREEALHGFCQCMQVLEKLRDNYASADYATQFLEAAIRKADIVVPMNNLRAKSNARAGENASSRPGVEKTFVQDRMPTIDDGRTARLTPPPDLGQVNNSMSLPANTASPMTMSGGLDKQVNPMQSASTPPNSDAASHHNDIPPPNDALFSMNRPFPGTGADVDDNTFDALINFDPGEGMDLDWTNPLGESIHGETGGFMVDMDWMKDGGDPLQWTSFSPHAVRMQPDEEALYLMSDPGLGTGVS